MRVVSRSLLLAFVAIAIATPAWAGTQNLSTPTDDSADTTVPVTDLPMVTIGTSVTQGGNDATSVTLSIGGTVVAADVASIKVNYGTVTSALTTNPSSLTNLSILLPGNEKGGQPWSFLISFNASAAGKTFNMTVSTIVGTNNAGLPFTTATRNATAPVTQTTTLGNGTDPSASPALCPGDAATMLDAFSFVTDGGSDNVTAVTIGLGAGNAASLSLLEVTSANGATVYGSVSNPASDNPTVTLSTPIAATTTLTEYRVRVTPKSHAAMPAPPGSSYSVTGTVTAFTPTANTTAGSDTGSDTITIDNTSPSAASWGTITPGDSQVELNWTNPGDGDFSEVVILRNTASISDVPSEGTTYSPGGTIGTSNIVYVGTATTFTDTGVTNDTGYWYAIFARDNCVNYSAEAETGPHTPTLVVETTTLGDGTDPAVSPTLCPGDGATMLDAFSFVTTAGTDDVTAIDVSLAAGTGASLSLIEVTSADGATVYGSVSSPIADTESITLSTPITATTTLTEYRLQVTPKAHAAMPAPPGSSFTLTGTVSAFTPTANTTAGSDTGSDTITIDNLSTADASWGAITAGDGQVDLAWTNPGDADFADVVILRATATVTNAPAEGSTYVAGNTIGAATVVYAGTGTTFSDVTVTNDTTYYYEIFARDGCSNYAAGVATGPHTPISAAAAKHQLGTPSDDSTDTSVAVTDHLMVTIPTTATQGGNDATSVRVSIGGTVAAADVDSVAVFYGGAEAGRVNNPVSLTDIDITMPGSEKGGADWTFVVSLASSAAGSTFDMTVTSITGTDNAAVPFTTATRNATVSGDTTTLGNGSDPAIAPALCPGDGAAMLDAFSFVTSGNSDDVTALTVGFAPGTAASLALVEVTSADGATVYGSVSAPIADDQSVALTSPITATGALVEYRIRVTPKAHGAMPAPPGTSYSVTGTVTGFVPTTNITAGSDGGSDTITIDNASPANPGWVTITPDDGQVALSWSNPGDADLADVLILRGTAAIADSPIEGTTYGAGSTIGASTVVFAGTGTTFSDTAVTNDTQYWYAIFARDDCSNYSTGAHTGPHTPVAGIETVTVGNGIDPANASICPGGPASDADAFSVVVSGGTDEITAVTVSFANGSNGVGLVEVVNDAGAVVHGSATNPNTNQPITLTTPITVTTTPTQYRIRVTPRGHAAMPAPPGASYAVAPTISDVTVTGAKTLTDSTSATVTIDNQSTLPPSWGSVTAGDGQVSLNWSNPGAADFASVVILRSTASVIATPVEGASYSAGNTIGAATVVYAGTGTSHTDSSVSNTIPYWYAIFARDGCGNYSVAAQTGPHTPNPPAQNGTTVTNSTAVVSSCRQITVTSLFGGDDDGDGSTRVEYNTSNSFPGTVACATAVGPSPRQCIVPGLSESTGYYIRVTFSDPDGLTGTNPQIIGPVTTTACGGDNVAPTLLVLSPARDAVIGGSELVRVQVWDADDPSPTVEWSVDGGSLSSATVNAAYDCDTNCRVMEFVIDTTGLSAGGHDLTVLATDSAGNVGTIRRGFQVQNAGSNPRGGGLLLKRSHGSQLCVDCHNIPTHSSQTTTTDYGNWAMECYSCHTPHNTKNIYLLRESILTPNSGERSVRFERNTVGATANSSTPGTASFVNEDNATRADGPCQVCHTRTGGATARWRNTAAGGNSDSHYTSSDGSPCTDCHSHAAGFAATGGSGCTGCHSGGQGSRRAVTADFTKKSHHVGTGGAMGGGLTDFDCVVCHAEGRINDTGDGVATTNRHNDGTCAGGKNCIDLKDADQWVNSASPAAGDFFPYDKDSITGAPASWSSGNGTWQTQTSTNLDPFCLSCHDADGAVSSHASLDGGSALNPFGDGTVTNDYDQITRDPNGSYPNGRVVDVASRVVATADLDQAGEARFVQRVADGLAGKDGIPDPPKGIYSRHAIRGKSLSPYSSTTGGMGNWVGSWNDTSVMGCADCHTTDGANGAAGNAHGSDSEYLLKDAFGGATLGRHNNYDPGTQTGGYVCWRCHDRNRYQRSIHTPNGADFEDSVGQIGPIARGNTTDQGKTAGNFLGMACTNCHGGAAYNQVASGRDWIPAPPYEFGSIHGTSQKIAMGPYDRNNGFTQQREAYRFMNGNSLRWFNPEGWTGSEPTCYTLGTSGDSGGDDFGMCSQHSGGTGGFGTRTRKLSY